MADAADATALADVSNLAVQTAEGMPKSILVDLAAGETAAGRAGGAGVAASALAAQRKRWRQCHPHGFVAVPRALSDGS